MEQTTAPGFSIKCGGSEISDSTLRSVTGIMAESRLDMPGAFDVTLSDQSLSYIDKDDGMFREGVRLEIAMGYNGSYTRLITGEISSVSAEMSLLGIYSHVAGFDLLHRLSRGTSYRRFGDDSADALVDSLIVNTLINDAGLTPVVDETHSRNAPRTQDNRSDLDFLVVLAKLNGYCLYADDENVFFTAEPRNRGEISLEWGKDIRSFYPRLSLNRLVKNIEARGRDASLDENYEEMLERSQEDMLFLSAAGRDMIARGSGGRSALSLHDSLITGAADAKTWLGSVMREQQAIVAANGSCAGDPNLLAGVVLKIENAGRFSGDYIVTRAIHRIGADGYTTEFEARMKP